MQERILEFLKKNQDYISGEEISEDLKISRQALWKHIQELRDQGFDIVAVPHLGYKLIDSPDRLLPSEIKYQLNTKLIGKKIYYYESVGSTMDAAFQLAINNAPEGTLVIAEAQNKGRGRLGRPWFSPKYKGIYISLILRPKILPNQASALTLLCAVSIAEAIRQYLGLDAEIKWPNDILIHGKKVGGILSELSAETDKINFLIIGFGINVNNDKKSLISGTTSLKEHKKNNISRVNFAKEILKKIEVNYLLSEKGNFDSILEKWREYSITLGRRVKVYCQNQHLEGQAFDIDKDGGLLIRKDNGVTHKLMAGDVVHCR